MTQSNEHYDIRIRVFTSDRFDDSTPLKAIIIGRSIISSDNVWLNKFRTRIKIKTEYTIIM